METLYKAPTTAEQRRAGMAALRRQLFTAHSRLAQDPRLTVKQRAEQQGCADYTRRIQAAKGEV